MSFLNYSQENFPRAVRELDAAIFAFKHAQSENKSPTEIEGLRQEMRGRFGRAICCAVAKPEKRPTLGGRIKSFFTTTSKNNVDVVNNQPKES